MFRLPWFVRLAVYAACFALVFGAGLSSMRSAEAVPFRAPPAALPTLAPGGTTLIAQQAANPNPLAPDPSESVFQVNPSGASLPAPDVTFSNITNTISGMQSQLSGFAQNLFLLLVGLDVFWMVVQFMLQKDNLGELFGQIFMKIITVSFIFFVVIQHGGELATTIIGSFTAAATKVTTDSNGNKISGYYGGSLSPIDILGEGAGFAAIPVTEAGILDAVPDEILGNGSTNDIKAESEMLTGAAFAIFGVFAGIAAEVAIATLEIYVVLNLGIIVTGFLGSRWTERYGQGFVAYSVSAGVKYFFVIVILGVLYQPLLTAASLEAIPIVGPAMYAATALVFAAILHAVPGFAASAMSGSSSSSGAQLAGALSQAFGSAGAMVKMGSAGIKNRATESVNEKAAAEQDRKTLETDTALASNRQMMREEAGDQRRARGFDDLAATGTASGSNGSGAAAAAALGAAGGASAANGALGGAGKSNGASRNRANATANGAVASGAAVNAAAGASAKQTPTASALPAKSGASAAANAANAAALGSGTSKTALPSSGAGAQQLGSVPQTAFSPNAGVGQGGYTSADAAAIAAGGPLGAAPPPTMGGFNLPQLADALYAPGDAPAVGVGGPQPFGLPDPAVTPLGAPTGSAAPAGGDGPPASASSAGLSAGTLAAANAASAGTAALPNASGPQGAAAGTGPASLAPAPTAPSPFTPSGAGTAAGSPTGASSGGGTGSAGGAIQSGAAAPAKPPSVPQAQAPVPSGPSGPPASGPTQNAQSFSASNSAPSFATSASAPAPSASLQQAPSAQQIAGMGKAQVQAAVQAAIAKQAASGSVAPEAKALAAQAKQLGVALPEAFGNPAPTAMAKRPSAVSIQKDT